MYFTYLEFISMQVVASSTHEVHGSPSDEEDANQSHLCCEFECNKCLSKEVFYECGV